MTISILPSLRSASVAFICAAVLKRESIAILTGYAAMRSTKVVKCCSASMVVGTRYATCFPSCTALNAALMATSVFPKPTSPQIRRSIIFVLSISSFVAMMACI